jgi:hypothetical protein
LECDIFLTVAALLRRATPGYRSESCLLVPSFERGSSMGSFVLNSVFFWEFERKMYLFSNKTKKNRKKPVETEEWELTKRAERLKVSCGTVLRTRMNTGDFALQNWMRFTKIFMRARRAGLRLYIES